MSAETINSPGIGNLSNKFAVLGGCVIDIVGTNGKRVTAQISAGRMFKGWVFAGEAWKLVGSTSFDGAALTAALGGGISKANLRITLYDGDSGSPNPVYVAMFGAGSFPYLRSTSQPSNYDFDGGHNLYFGFADIDGNPVSCGYMGDTTTYRLDASGQDYDVFQGFPGTFALTDTTNYPHQTRPSHYMTPVQAGVAAGIWPVTGWFPVPSGSLAALYAVLQTGVMRVGVHDISPGDQYYDFTQGLASDVLDIPFDTVPPTLTPQNLTLDLWVWRELTKFDRLDREITFGPGYEKALLYALALEMYPEYPAAAEKYDLAELVEEAESAVRDLEILNESDKAAMEPPE